MSDQRHTFVFKCFQRIVFFAITIKFKIHHQQNEFRFMDSNVKFGVSFPSSFDKYEFPSKTNFPKQIFFDNNFSEFVDFLFYKC